MTAEPASAPALVTGAAAGPAALGAVIYLGAVPTALGFARRRHRPPPRRQREAH
jgi:hypothetical protein